jgi:ketosteroid isomerase-like protein
MDIKETFYDFVNAINKQDINKIYSLMADGHIFFDAWRWVEKLLEKMK